MGERDEAARDKRPTQQPNPRRWNDPRNPARLAQWTRAGLVAAHVAMDLFRL